MKTTWLNKTELEKVLLADCSIVAVFSGKNRTVRFCTLDQYDKNIKSLNTGDVVCKLKNKKVRRID